MNAAKVQCRPSGPPERSYNAWSTPSRTWLLNAGPSGLRRFLVVSTSGINAREDVDTTNYDSGRLKGQRTEPKHMEPLRRTLNGRKTPQPFGAFRLEHSRT